MPTPWFFVKATLRPRDPDDRDLAGEDVALGADGVPLAPSGSWATVTRADAARQSVLREAAANPRSLVRRPEWGMGMPAKLFHGVTKSFRDDLIATITRRLAANQRVSSVQQVAVSDLDGVPGVGVDLRFTAGGRPVDLYTVIAPKA